MNRPEVAQGTRGDVHLHGPIRVRVRVRVRVRWGLGCLNREQSQVGRFTPRPRFIVIGLGLGLGLGFKYISAILKGSERALILRFVATLFVFVSRPSLF